VHAVPIGNRGMHHLVEELANGEAVMTREQAEEWLDAMAATSICGLGQARLPDAERVQALAGSLRAARGARNKMSSMVRFTLDGREASAPEGELLVHAAARHGVFIPTLCHDDKLDPYGGCRMCVVGVEGSPRPLPACATRVAEGMVVSTNSSVPAYRKTLTEMLLAEHLDPNPGGRPNELTDLADELDAEAPFVLPTRSARTTRTETASWATRPTRASSATAACATRRRSCSAPRSRSRAAGRTPRIVPTWERSWLDTECELCGGCLSVCPTGAIFEKFLDGTEQPERELVKTKTTCTFCGVGCQIDLNVDPETNRIVKVTSEPHYVSNEGNLCVKGRFAFNFVHHPDRLTKPMVRGEDGELHETSWDDALQAAADGLNRVKASTARSRSASSPPRA
jgi:predicted molibdopterin-dependent oxidoreductase YjgC